MAIVSFTVGSVNYNAATASAQNQDEVLSLIGVETLQRIFATSADIEPVKTLVPMMMTLPQGVKRRVSEILCAKLFVAGNDKVTVTVHDFECRMVEWNQVLSELMIRNFADFFTWLASVREEETQTANS